MQIKQLHFTLPNSGAYIFWSFGLSDFGLSDFFNSLFWTL